CQCSVLYLTVDLDQQEIHSFPTRRSSDLKEERILDWIFEEGELEAFSKEDLLAFMRFRIDDSLKALGLVTMYNVSDAAYAPMQWFDEEILANSLDDFFAKRPVEYTKHDKSITADDLF